MPIGIPSHGFALLQGAHSLIVRMPFYLTVDDMKVGVRVLNIDCKFRSQVHDPSSGCANAESFGKRGDECANLPMIHTHFHGRKNLERRFTFDHDRDTTE